MVDWQFAEALEIDTHGAVTRWWARRRPLAGAPPIPDGLVDDLQTARLALEGRLEAVRRKIASMIRAIEDGLYQPSMKARMAKLEAEKAALEERLAAAAPELPKVRLHPNLAGGVAAEGGGARAGFGQPLDKAEVAEIVRSQIEQITLTPTAEGGLDIHLYGDLARILQPCEARILQLCEAGSSKSERPGHGRPGRGLSVVAGRSLRTSFPVRVGPRTGADYTLPAARQDLMNTYELCCVAIQVASGPARRRHSGILTSRYGAGASASSAGP
jgi:hypothetical protein